MMPVRENNMIIEGLIPAVIQDATTQAVLMVGYMNQEAYAKTLETNVVTFFSRSKNRLWTKGETSGNKLEVVSIFQDCDSDALLIKAKPLGPTCHNGTTSCFYSDGDFLQDLENTIKQRESNPDGKSYVSSLFESGLNRMAQKVGEEGVEVVIAALQSSDQAFCEEAGDLLFHLMVLLRAKKLCLSDVIAVLRARMAKPS